MFSRLCSDLEVNIGIPEDLAHSHTGEMPATVHRSELKKYAHDPRLDFRNVWSVEQQLPAQSLCMTVRCCGLIVSVMG